MKKAFFLIFFITFNLLIIQKTEAADLNIECGASGCHSSSLSPLFSESLDGAWYPGRAVIKTIEIKNIESSQKQIRMGVRGSSSDQLAEVMFVKFSGSIVIWQGSLMNLFGQEIDLGTFNPLETREFNMNSALSSNADDFYQGKSTSFDLLLGFWQDEVTVGQGGQDTDTSSGNSSQGMVAGARSFISDFLGASMGINFSENKSQDEVLGSKALYTSCPCSVWCYLLGFLTAFLLSIPLYLLRKNIKKYLNRLRGK